MFGITEEQALYVGERVSAIGTCVVLDGLARLRFCNGVARPGPGKNGRINARTAVEGVVTASAGQGVVGGIL